ncbi:MAG: tRNA epoxyqueuosine(34) reductase QueG [Rhodospirillaceae bacterium]
MTELKAAIRERARAEGFDAVGFASAAADPKDRAALAQFVRKGWAGDMDWLGRDALDDGGRRGDLTAMMPGAKTAVVVAASYGPAIDPLAPLARRDRGTVSVYAQAAKDYHDVLKKRLKRLGRWLADAHGGDLKVFVDTAPVMEKPLAGRAGIGWQGKHSNLVSRDFGSWLFLGELVTSLEIPPDLPEPDHCGTCTRCIDACPTDAIPEPYRLEATRCISYLTIEHKGAIDPRLMAAMGNHVYGCDDCLAVCPWNKFAEPADEPAFRPRPELAAPRLADLADLDDASFRQVFAASPIKRTGRDRFVRNVLIAIGNSGEPALAGVAERLADDAAPLVAEAAAWALGRLRGVDG